MQTVFLTASCHECLYCGLTLVQGSYPSIRQQYKSKCVIIQCKRKIIHAITAGTHGYYCGCYNYYYYLLSTELPLLSPPRAPTIVLQVMCTRFAILCPQNDCIFCFADTVEDWLLCFNFQKMNCQPEKTPMLWRPPGKICLEPNEDLGRPRKLVDFLLIPTLTLLYALLQINKITWN